MLFGERSADALPPSPSWPQLMGMGASAIIGTGILTLIDVGVDRAAPTVLISFAIGEQSALSYAELSAMLPAAGSAYSYSYAGLRNAFFLPTLKERVQAHLT